MQTQLDFSTDSTQTGFRLQELQVLNWGTFDQKIWTIKPTGFNALLTGDIGSGKSTLVDALTTLLVPHQKITYNKAAGADSKERSRYSYIRGEYKNQKDELSQSSKSVYLRDENHYSVLLARFANLGFEQSLSLAQIFWIKDHKDHKFFVIAEDELSIQEHFTQFGPEISQLKKRLKTRAHTQVFESFRDYSGRFRTQFGIKSEKALDLFYQTVSMKSVGNLTEFVRKQMLEKSEVKEKIEALKKNFENLNQAHQAVIKAKEQLELLKPLAKDLQACETIGLKIEDIQHCLQALPSFFAQHQSALLQKEISRLQQSLQGLQQNIDAIAQELKTLREQEINLREAIANDAQGRRLSEIEHQIEKRANLKAQKLSAAQNYQALSQALELPHAKDANAFISNLNQAQNKQSQIEIDYEKSIERRDDLKINLNKLKEKVQEDQAELASLKNRRTQIPETNLNLRERLLTDLKLETSDLPFVGELLQVKKEAKDWEGALERLLHNFGLSLLVADPLYQRVSHYVNQTNLKGRLVYFKVAKQKESRRLPIDSTQGVFDKLEIKSTTEFDAWLEHELQSRFNYVCCQDMAQFRREPYALTQEGQIKSGQQRHEKDDRRKLWDRRHFILGWSNLEKIKAITISLNKNQAELNHCEKEIKSIEARQKNLREQTEIIRDLLKFNEFSEIHWQKEAEAVQKLEQEKTELEASSEQLKALRKSLEQTQEKLAQQEKIQKESEKKFYQAEIQIQNHEAGLEDCLKILKLMNEEEQHQFFPKIQATLNKEPITLKNLNTQQESTRSQFENQREKQHKKEKQLRDRIIKQMQNYKNTYPAECIEVDASLEAGGEFKQFLAQVESDDLPRFEKKFKELLNEGTINDIAIFKNQLETSQQDIEAKIQKINESLKEIEYTQGRYIQLVPQTMHDLEIKGFKEQLKSCLENTLGESELYSENKFLQVKAILDRFNSTQNTDLAWTQKVTDVRNWFVFNASIRFIETDEEDEFISDSSGKSGGQKEKLAYTILASALAYQFGLEWNQKNSRSFRFVVIDEAFGRGSDESTRYGLELFKKLNLQLLIVTPLQKINVIEDYIRAVHFVSNPDGHHSEVLNLTREEYVESKVEYMEKVAG